MQKHISAAAVEHDEGEGSDLGGDDSGDEGEGRRKKGEDDEPNADEDLVCCILSERHTSTTDAGVQAEDRPNSPDALVVRPKVENAGPTEEADAEFAKELAKMMSDTSSDARKVDKRTALAMWDSAALPSTGTTTNRRKRNGFGAGNGENDGVEDRGMMKFTVLSKKGNKQQVCPDVLQGGVVE